VLSPRPASRVLSILLILAGIAIALLAAFADVAGYGTGLGFGYYQMIILIGGIVTALIGVALLVHGRSGRNDSGDFEPEP
jgi:tetrahydromethanopterin S-methyltransferase subunit C